MAVIMDSSEKSQEITKAWTRIQREAKSFSSTEPQTASVLNNCIFNRINLADALAHILASHLDNPNLETAKLYDLFYEEFSKTSLLYNTVLDLKATVERDPACNFFIEPLFFFKGFQAVQAHRASNSLWGKNRPFISKLLQSAISRNFGVDFHPAAKIGHGILIDHATNIVVGETAVIGNNVSILHGVTLGGTGKESGQRHPKIGDGVMIGAHAQLLGNIKIGKGAKIGAGSVVLKSVAPHTTVAGVPAEVIGRPNTSMPALEMRQNFTDDQNS
jgi:serine O-acetyltransferase